MKLEFTVRLNGTDKNPYEVFGLTGNPFKGAVIPDSMERYRAHLLHLSRLGEDPIPDENYIREFLKGWPRRFVDGLCARFKKGHMVEVRCTFDEK